MVFNFLNNESKSDSTLNNGKNMFYENLNKDQKNNYELLTILSLPFMNLFQGFQRHF